MRDASLWGIVVLGYLVGGVLPARYWVRRVTGELPEALGDEPGTAGTWRKAGPIPSILVFIFDFTKGFLPIFLVDRLGGGAYPVLLTAAAVAPVAGHNWPIQHRFRGGRGMAAAIGVTLYLAPLAFTPALLAGGAVALRRRRTPWVGIVGFPLGLLLMGLQGQPPAAIGAATAAIVTVGVRYYQWTREKQRWI